MITLREGFGLNSLISAYNLDKNLIFYNGICKIGGQTISSLVQSRLQWYCVAEQHGAYRGHEWRRNLLTWHTIHTGRAPANPQCVFGLNVTWWSLNFMTCAAYLKKKLHGIWCPEHKQSHVLIGYGQFSRHIRMKKVHNNKVFRSKLTSPLYCWLLFTCRFV